MKSYVPSRTFSVTLCRFKRKKSHSGHESLDDADHNDDDDDEEEDNEEDFIDDTEAEELFQQQVPTGIGEEDHRVFIVHPDVKWGQKKQYLTTGK